MDFTADLSKVKTKPDGHAYAGNKQLEQFMRADVKGRKRIEKKYGTDTLDRISAKGGRRNPKDGDWHHDIDDKNKLILMKREKHQTWHKDHSKSGGKAKYWNTGKDKK